MSNYRKRRSSEDLENDSKRVSYDRHDRRSYIKQEYSPNGRVDYTGVHKRTPVRIQSAAIYEPQRYYNSYYVDACKNDEKGNANTSLSYQDAITMYDKQRQMNFKHEVYLNSLRQLVSRYVNINDLKRHLSDIDIRCLSNWKFVTAYDLAQELESSLKYFIDTRNELFFLRKLHRQQYVPFSYNEINISNTSGVYNRMKFLENESAYRSNRMNQLFHQLQSVVIPSIIDDIRYVHSDSYEKSWANRARYWFNKFKQIKYEKCLAFNNNQTNYQAHKYQRSDAKRHRVKNEPNLPCNVNIKSEVVIMPHKPAMGKKSVKIDMMKKVELKRPNSHHNQQYSNIEKLNKSIQPSIQTVSDTVEETIKSDDCNNNLISPSSAQEQSHETASENKLDKHRADDKSVENENGDKSLILVEQDISVVTVIDDDNQEASNIPVPPEGYLIN